MMNCVENGLLKTLVRLLDSHVTIQTQAISLLEEILSHNNGDKVGGGVVTSRAVASW